MSTTEALRTQLDPVVRASRWRTVDLRDEHPEQAEMVDLEDELKQTQEENVRLSQQVSANSQATTGMGKGLGRLHPRSGGCKRTLRVPRRERQSWCRAS